MRIYYKTRIIDHLSTAPDVDANRQLDCVGIGGDRDVSYDPAEISTSALSTS